MKNTLFLTNATTAVLSLAVGFCLSQAFSEKTEATTKKSTPAKLLHRQTSDSQSLVERMAENKNRLPEEEQNKSTALPHSENQKSSSPEPTISIPFSLVVQALNEQLKDRSEFIHLDSRVRESLFLLGATESETKEIQELLGKSKADILAAEKTHVKTAEITSNSIQLDTSGMRESAEKIIEQTKEGIRNSLPSGSAEVLISAIDWKNYYPTDKDQFTTFTIQKSSSGKLTAWERNPNLTTIYSFDTNKYPDNGQAIPADEAFTSSNRWKPLLKGLTLLPIDEK